MRCTRMLKYNVSFANGSTAMSILPLTLEGDIDIDKCAALKIHMQAKYLVSISTGSKVMAKLYIDIEGWP